MTCDNREIMQDSDFEYINIDSEDDTCTGSTIPVDNAVEKEKDVVEARNSDKVSLTMDDLLEINYGPSVLSWFVTLMITQVPVVNVLYYMYIAISSKNAKRNYATAWLLVHLLFLCITIAIFVVVLDYGVEFMDKLLAYMEML